MDHQKNPEKQKVDIKITAASTMYEHLPSLIATLLVAKEHTRHVLYRAAMRFRVSSDRILFFHILIPNLEVLQYWFMFYWNGKHAQPTYLNFGVMILHIWTSHVLVTKGHYAGHKSIAQPVFHAQMLLRLIISFCSVSFGSPDLHLATIRINAAASYPRILIWAAKKLDVFATYKDIYTAVMFVGSLLAMHDSGISFGPLAFICLWGILCFSETWAAHELGDDPDIMNFPNKAPLKSVVLLLLSSSGFINQDVLNRQRKEKLSLVETTRARKNARTTLQSEKSSLLSDKDHVNNPGGVLPAPRKVADKLLSIQYKDTRATSVSEVQKATNHVLPGVEIPSKHLRANPRPFPRLLRSSSMATLVMFCQSLRDG